MKEDTRPKLPTVYQDEIRNATTYIGGTLRRLVKGCDKKTIMVSVDTILIMLHQIELIEKSLNKKE